MKKLKDLELQAIDNIVAYLLEMRKAIENTGGVGDLGIRKKQTHWVAGEPASSYKPGMEDCGK
jgi:hypothetical protein